MKTRVQYTGKMMDEAARLCEHNREVLLSKKVAFFVCCTTPGGVSF